MEFIGEGVSKSFKRFENKVNKLDVVLINIKKELKMMESIEEEIVEYTNKYNTTTNPKKAELYINKIKKAEAKYNRVVASHNKYIKIYDEIVAESKKVKKDYETAKNMKMKDSDIGKKINKSTKNIKKVEKTLVRKIGETDTKIKGAIKPKIIKTTDNRAKAVQQAKAKVERIKQSNAKAIQEGKPEKVKEVREDVLNFFHKVKYQYAGINSLRQLYDQIMGEIDKLNTEITYVVLYIVDAGNLVRHISINALFLDDFDTFKNRVDEITAGNVAGSDAMDEKENIDLNSFGLAYFDESQGRGKSDKVLFECENIEDGFCGFNALKKCGYEYDKDKKDLFFLKNIIDVINMNGLKINVLGNTFYVEDINKIKSGEGKMIDFEYNKSTIKIKAWELKISDIELCYIKTVENATHTIIYDEINQHFDVIKGDIRFQEGISINIRGDVIKNGKKVFTTQERIKNNIKLVKQQTLEYIFFDYETVIEFEESSCMKEYSLSILQLTNNELENLTDADNRNDIKVVNDIRKRCCKTFIGFDCSLQFIKWILDNQENKIFCFIGFNNTNFDNFIFLNALLKNKENKSLNEYNIGEIFYNGSQLLNFKLNGRHHTFDIHKHLMGSLRDNCESFKIKCCKKLEFNHDKAQQLYLDNKLIDFITNNQELKDYNEYDVLATAVLFCKYRKALSEIPATEPYTRNLTDTKTIGSLIFKVFEDHKKTKKFNFQITRNEIQTLRT